MRTSQCQLPTRTIPSIAAIVFTLTTNHEIAMINRFVWNIWMQAVFCNVHKWIGYFSVELVYDTYRSCFAAPGEILKTENCCDMCFRHYCRTQIRHIHHSKRSARLSRILVSSSHDVQNRNYQRPVDDIWSYSDSVLYRLNFASIDRKA